MATTIKCNNVSCDYCVRNNTNVKGSYICILSEIELEHWYDDVSQCKYYESRHGQQSDNEDNEHVKYMMDDLIDLDN